MTAWTSPLLTSSEMPLRISRPSTVTRKSLISKSAIDPPDSTRALSMRLRLNPSFVLNLCGTAVQGDPQRVHRQRRALHPTRTDLDPQLFQQVAGREVFQLADRPAYDHVGQHRRGCLTDGPAPDPKPDRAGLAVVEPAL